MDPADGMRAATASTPTPLTVETMLADHLDDVALEELICVYLQTRFGYLVRTPPPGTTGYDYVLRNAGHCEALVHARGGDTLVARDAVSLPTDVVDDVFVFSPTHSYGPDPAPNVREISADELIDFVRSERWSLPQTVSNWLEQAEDEEPAGSPRGCQPSGEWTGSSVQAAASSRSRTAASRCSCSWSD